MATLADVARLAGVSTATVSHVVNGTRNVRPETRRLVEEAIEETGYSQNTLARSLVTASTKSIAVVMSAISNPYFGQVLQGIEAEAVEHDYTLLLAESRDDPDHELHVVRSMRARRVDGLVLAPSAHPERALEYATAQGIPMVLVDRIVDDRYDQVGPDNTEPTAQLVDHLAALGHRRIGHVRARSDLARHRLRAAALDQSTVEATGAGCATAEISGAGAGNTETAAAQATWRLLAAERPPTAIVYDNDRMAVAAVARSAELGVRVPADLAVLSWQDSMLCRVVTPAVTALSRDAGRDAEAAVRLLLELIETGAADDSDLPAGVLVPRASTAGESG